MSTYIVRVTATEPVVAGTVERPGEELRTFADGEGLLRILEEWAVEDRSQPGYGSGSTSSSAIRET